MIAPLEERLCQSRVKIIAIGEQHWLYALSQQSATVLVKVPRCGVVKNPLGRSIEAHACEWSPVCGKNSKALCEEGIRW